MKKMFSILLCIAICFLLRSVAFAADQSVVASGTCGAEGADISWTLYNNGELTIDGIGMMADYNWWDNYAPWYNERDIITSVQISDDINSVGKYAFYDCYSLESITIGKNVTEIGDYAFNRAEALSCIVLNDGLQYIGQSAFDGCKCLLKIKIPQHVSSIGEYAFNGCIHLTSINVDAKNQHYCSLNGVLLDKAKTTVIRCPIGFIGGLTIPDGVSSIHQFAFSDCVSLTEVIFPTSVITIEQGAFSECKKLSSILLPNKLSEIGWGAFEGCESITSISLPDSLNSIGGQAFSGCTNLTDITIPQNVTTIGDEAFYCCYNLTSIFFEGDKPDLGRTITGNTGCYYFFYHYGNKTYHYKYTTIGVGNYIVEDYNWIGIDEDGVYHGFCSKTNEDTSWTYKDGLLRISGEGPMPWSSPYSSDSSQWNYLDDEIETIIVEEGITSIGKYSFVSMENLYNVVIPNSIDSISDNAFLGCTNLKYALYMGTPTKWSHQVLVCYGNESLTNATLIFKSSPDCVLPSALREIEAEAFMGSSFTFIKLPDNLVSINSRAFANCHNLACIYIPQATTEIDAHAFDNVNNLIIIGTSGSTAETVASKHGFAFIPMI